MPNAASNITIGVLALQGGFARHIAMIERLGARAIEVRHDFSNCDGLILPGGESTAIRQLMSENGLSLSAFPGPIFGTCAGLILLAHSGLLDIDVQRNAYGRQCASFVAPVDFQGKQIEGVFIRAPRITQTRCTVLATYQGEPVMVQQGDYFGTTFHPELTNDPAVPMVFLERCKRKQSPLPPSKIKPIRSSPTTLTPTGPSLAASS